MDLREARARWASHAPALAEKGIILQGATSYLPDSFKSNFRLAMDAQPTLSTTPNSGIPAWMTNYVDPQTVKIVFAPNRAAEIFGEVKKGDWLMETAWFSVVEHTGEVSSYGDYSENGSAGVNTNWPQRQAYLFQTVKQYGEREIERAGLSKLNWVSEIDQAAATVMNKFSNLTYFFGVNGLQNYGLLNDPSLSASLTPSLKAWGGVGWISGGVIKATANEIYLDIETLFSQLVAQTAGTVTAEDEMTLAMSPGSAVALTATNSFNVNVSDLLKKNFPKIKIETAVQYGQISASNPQGIAGGNFVQLIAKSVEGQETGYCAFNEKLRSHPIIRQLSSFRQKLTGGSWGSIIRQPMAISSMIGV